MSVHVLKSWPKFFRPIVVEDRTHELRHNDRGFTIGDTLELHEYDPDTKRYSGATCVALVSSLTSAATTCAVSDVALHPEYSILSIRVLEWTAATGPTTVLRTAIV